MGLGSSSAHWSGKLRQWLNQPNDILRFGLVVGFYFALVFVTYLPILPGSFLMDDHRLIKDDNDLVNGKAGLLSVWFSGDFSLSTFGWWLQWHGWGENPAGYHAVNILLQVASTVLLWRLLVKLKIPGAWLAAAVFAVHPVCVNSVARAAELKNTLSLPFFIFSFLAYLHYESSALYPVNPTETVPDSGRHRATIWYTLSLTGFVLALLSKTSTIMLPVVLISCAAWQRGRVARKDLVHTAPYFFLSLAFGLMSVWYQKYQALAGESLPSASFWERLAEAGWNFWFYLGKAFLPLHLSIVYLRWEPDLARLTAYLPDFLILATFFIGWYFRRSWGRHVLFGLGCFLITLFPAIGLFDSQFLVKFQVSDHLQYLPLIAPLVLVMAVLATVLNSKMFPLIAAALILVLGSHAYERSLVFSTPERLMRDTLAKNPAAWQASNDLGVILAEQKNYPAAEAQFTDSLKSNPDNSDARLNLGKLLTLEGRLQEAQAHLAFAVNADPHNAALRNSLATVWDQLGRPRDAIVQSKIALRLEPTIETRLALAGLLYDTGDYNEAASEYRTILSTKPDWTEPLNNLAWILATCPDEATRNGTEAVERAENACLLTKFKDSHTLGTLAAAYAEAGRFPEAMITADAAIRLATATHEMQLATLTQQLLAYYRAGKAWHGQPIYNGN